MTPQTHPSDCDCVTCLDWDADDELGVLDLEDRLDAAFERADEATAVRS